MQERAREVGIQLTVQDVNDDLKAEIRELRRLIGKQAADYVSDGDTIILDSGSTTINMAHFLDAAAQPDRDHQLGGRVPNAPAPRARRQPDPDRRAVPHEDRSRWSGAARSCFSSEIRVDKVFLVAGGVDQFGISSGTSWKPKSGAR